jgi:hypothetical protein
VARDRSRLHEASVSGLLGQIFDLAAYGVDHRLVNAGMNAGRRSSALGVGNGSLELPEASTVLSDASDAGPGGDEPTRGARPLAVS